ncbi:MAG: asparagine synthase (glutamine-hydrolyzing) [Bryobacterales bacterium]|nr:asparagine synthase (glutamine-hydrolyzing) [Bryobacterales bacterium]
MCGIAGFVSTNSPPGAERILRRMGDVIAHRGPDDSGYYSDTHAFLAHRRLSIVDLSTGHQPMANEDRTKWVIYNGEIFNHAELRPELEARGHRYGSRADTEAILHGWEEYGPTTVTKFNGMFAFAAWDAKRRRLFCARDRHGIKPFYYYWDGKHFVFASEIKALLEFPEVPAICNESALAEHLTFGYVSSEETLFHGIQKLPPAHYLELEWRDGRFELSTNQYWETPLFADPMDIDEHEAVEECRRRFEKTVESRLMADVPLGVFLSGGVDSSAVTAVMRKHFSGPLKSFAVGYREQQYAELTWAEQVAKAIGTEHHEIVIGFDDYFGSLPKMVWHEDEPICFPASIPLYFVSELASREVKVVLTGEGSDELFAGYERYRYHLINEAALKAYRFVPGGLQGLVRGLVPKIPNLSLRRKLEHTFLFRTPDLDSLYLDNFYGGFPLAQVLDLATSPLIRHSSPYRSYHAFWSVQPQQSTLARLLFSDHKSYLIELLMKQDQMSMAASIESRVPFLDHTFVEFAMRLPDKLKLGKGGKRIFKKAVEDLLPKEIVYRTKMGFPTPLRQWLGEERSNFVRRYLCEPKGFLSQIMDLRKLQALMDRHERRQEDATDRIWRLVNLQVWGDLFLLNRTVPWMGGEFSRESTQQMKVAMPAA